MTSGRADAWLRADRPNQALFGVVTIRFPANFRALRFLARLLPQHPAI
jgi:hypothetical protein